MFSWNATKGSKAGITATIGWFQEKAVYIRPVFFIRVIICIILSVPAALLAADAKNTHQTVTVAVASNFMVPMKAIAARFEEESGYQLILSFGSSGKLYAQILNGAPFQVFLSADQEKPQALEANDEIVAGSRYTYALGRLVLWSNSELILEDTLQSGYATPGSESQAFNMLASLTKHDRLAIANPRLAPYGAAAVEVLSNLGVYDQVSEKIVRGENVSQAFQFVETGNAKLGFVALSQVTQVSETWQQRAWVVPDSFHTPIQQDMVLLSKGENNEAAIAFHNWMKGDHAQKLIQSFGYDSYFAITGSESAN